MYIITMGIFDLVRKLETYEVECNYMDQTRIKMQKIRDTDITGQIVHFNSNKFLIMLTQSIQFNTRTICLHISLYYTYV
jgi:hypothetical protein